MVAYGTSPASASAPSAASDSRRIFVMHASASRFSDGSSLGLDAVRLVKSESLPVSMVLSSASTGPQLGCAVQAATAGRSSMSHWNSSGAPMNSTAARTTASRTVSEASSASPTCNRPTTFRFQRRFLHTPISHFSCWCETQTPTPLHTR